jgi:hypothetical protein
MTQPQDTPGHGRTPFCFYVSCSSRASPPSGAHRLPLSRCHPGCRDWARSTCWWAIIRMNHPYDTVELGSLISDVAVHGVLGCLGSEYVHAGRHE